MQRWVNENNVNLSLGYFEAWVFLPSIPAEWSLYDVTDLKVAYGNGNQFNTTLGQWRMALS